uniref:Uncharacterized protein n=1 Tax=Anguilla anguilla TaxID=7936 RepID=A0A0E9XCX6_ANGAN
MTTHPLTPDLSLLTL